ncbi:Putative metal-dependent hydrolase yfiT [Mycolicibacterium phlei]|uniref:DinB family protein n=1 Tax=Mycobacteroides chelonae TaxID=1774 RepID=UPI000618B99B|nr:DinB family protein [Mycobacteroides chelonae]VEG15795.1 Putative metal-dependent hydrolase yfiT [Mycolicibacterium phlei]AKC38479.1 hypothetical protein GR01_07770 [Mycobacteroides chelonae]ANB00875.1 hypothetical protein BB28_08250 [Mycobacteroides chelonae CCUG 47445]OLT75157.1 hypothetical protein BKG56_15385 [Mycobacteroides chelonae]ORV12805.1 hypothetical protein AWB96_15625 [Mycobacteroides chelonae]
MTVDLAVLLDQLVDSADDPALRAQAVKELAAQESTPGQRNAFEIVLSGGGAHVLQLLRDAPAQFRGIFNSHPEETWRRSPAEGEWNAVQVIHHLADNEAVNAVRIRSILTEDEPEIFGYDSDPWTRFFDLESVDEALHRFEILRLNTVRLVESLSEGDLSRRGVLSYRGAESVRVLLAVLAGHDLDHVRQMTAAMESPAA